MTGSFIVFEGGEGCGKSTQARLLARHLDAVLTREPGGTDIGARIRALLLDPETRDLDERAEALLMAADRAQHVHEVIRPALIRGQHVVCDRYLYSSIAYQGFGRGLPVDEVRSLSLWATAALEPDLVILLTVPADVAAARLARDLDRFERAGDGFHSRVVDGFAQLAAADPVRWLVLDGTPPVDELAARIRQEVAARLAGVGR